MDNKNRVRIDRFIITLVSVACLGLTIESYIMGWEFWVPPLLILGTVALWILHTTQRFSPELRENLCLGFGMLSAFFHGVHESSFFDVSVVIILMFIVYSFLSKNTVLNLILAEYVVLMGIQAFFVITRQTEILDTFKISRLCLHLVVTVSVYLACRMIIRTRNDYKRDQQKKDDALKTNENDMEDFLSNISHELRTPVNVVSGMSSIFLKTGDSEEVRNIQKAGLRLSHQIEDIQDYTEIKQGGQALEEEKYMSTSLINDVVATFNANEKRDELELIVDLDPRVPTMMVGDIKKIHKIFRHLLENALKFTKRGGVYIKVYTSKREYGVNLSVEISDTGIGMSRKTQESVSDGMYQANKKRNRSTGGIGIGLPIVYGFVHDMGGFVKIESTLGYGTTVKVSIPQRIGDATHCLTVSPDFTGDIVFYNKPDKYKVPALREFYKSMAVNLASGLKIRLYSATNRSELDRVLEERNISHIFMGQEEYAADSAYFDGIAASGTLVTVSADPGFNAAPGSGVSMVSKPLYGFPIVRILNRGTALDTTDDANKGKLDLSGVTALVVDDEPMNLVVATGLFKDYGMVTETAESGKEAVDKFIFNEYDVIFLDHMMPEMDGVECAHILQGIAEDKGRHPAYIALTANALSGAREMFIQEGFDGFIAKPIDVKEFERVMIHVLPESKIRYEGRGEDA